MSMTFKIVMIAFIALLASLLAIFLGPHHPEVWGKPLAQWLIYLVALMAVYVSAVQERRAKKRE
jgi:hypothetical protein